MPTGGGYHSRFWESDPKRWAKCRQEVEDAMVAEGWNPKARKFNDVRHKRAVRLWANG